MNKSILAREYARKMVEKWKRFDAGEIELGRAEFTLEHKLIIAFKQGFESGQRHQKKLQQAKVKA